MTIQLPQPTALQKFLEDNNPPFTDRTVEQVFITTFEKRKAAAQGPQFSQVLNGILEPVCSQMLQDFTELSSKVIAEWSLTQPDVKEKGGKLSSVYHRGPHGAEMSKDAELLLAKQAEKLFANESQRKLFIKMAQVAHAIHDVIQDKGAPNNEIASAQAFTEACNAIFDKYKENMPVEQLSDLKKVAEHFGWEAIVVGTTFDNKKKRPVVDILNEAHRTFGEEAPKERDVAIACATFACGKNDTRRMEVNADSYGLDPQLQRLQKLQSAVTGGSNNIFMQFISQRDAGKDPKFVWAATHMIGQNCRMICELKTHFGNKGDDDKFAEFLTKAINKASTTFDANQHQELKEEINKSPDIDLFFDKLLTSFTSAFGEINFAKGLSAENFEKAVEDFNELYPGNRFELAGKGSLWQKYGSEAEAFIASIQAKIDQIKDDPALDAKQKEEKVREYKVQVFTDLALYGGHQMGAALIRENKDTVKAYDKLIEDTHAKLKGIVVNKSIPNDSEGLQEYLAGLKSHQPNQNPLVIAQHRAPSISFSKPPSHDQHVQAIKLCEGLLKATQERDRIQTQILNLNKSANKELGPRKDEPDVKEQKKQRVV